MTTTKVQQRETRPTYLAIFDGRNGYAIDCYPEELADTRRFYGKHVIGEFVSGGAALRAARARVVLDCAARNARRVK